MKSALTLDRILSRFGVASRQEAREAIRGGRLKVNGRVIRDPEFWVRPEKDAVHLDGERLKASRKVYLLFYKPKGAVTSHGDPDGRKTVYDYLGNVGRWVFPVGRLDKDTSGLLLMTNDTLFADFVTNPKSRVVKTYRVKVSGLLQDAVINQLQEGVRMQRGDWARPIAVRRLQDRNQYTWLEVALTEGKNREVRRMIEAVGFKVLKLVRTAIGPLTLKGLEIGKWRNLTAREVAAVRKSRPPNLGSEQVFAASASGSSTTQTGRLQTLSD
ncbi:MAG TPA: pseudouridine synthase [Terriglobia bacterium]|nr:pseudouridine synthase [Terriglobia bacterium]